MTTSVLPGQTLKADVYNQNFTLFEPFLGDYIRIYKVPYDVTNNLTELNTVGGTAKFVGSAFFEYLQYPYNRQNYSSIVANVEWKEPGKFQIVMLSQYGQLFCGISKVFEVVDISRDKKTTITIDTNSTFPGQNFNVTIYKPDPPYLYGLQIAIAYIKAKDKVVEYTNGTKGWVSMSRVGTWNSTTTYLSINDYFNEWRYGLYKVVVLAADIVIGVSKPLLIKRPNIQIPLTKRTYSQWETIPTTIIQPYSVNTHNSYYTYEIILKSQPDSYYSNGCETQFRGPDECGYPVNQWQNRTLVTFAPGIYNIRLVVHKVWWTEYRRDDWVDYVVSIRNTTFRVIQNTAHITIANNKTKFKYGDILNYSFTTTSKVPLHGPIMIYSTGKSWLPSEIGTLRQNADSNSNSSTTTNSNTLYGTLLIETNTFGCPYGRSPYNVQLRTSESTSDIENAFSSIISIDLTSTPEDQCL